MCAKSILYAFNSQEQALTEGGVINFGMPVLKEGHCANIIGGNAVLNGSGEYAIDANITLTAGAGVTTVSLYEDGVPIPGAFSSRTTVATAVYTVPIPCVVNEYCNRPSTITAVITGPDATVTNAAIRVVKL